MARGAAKQTPSRARRRRRKFPPSGAASTGPAAGEPTAALKAKRRERGGRATPAAWVITALLDGEGPGTDGRRAPDAGAKSSSAGSAAHATRLETYLLDSF